MRAGRWMAWAAVFAALGLARAAFAEANFEPQEAFGGFGIGKESFDKPVDVAVDKDENVYVVDQGNNRIQVLDRRGRFVREWGKRGIAAGAMDTPNAIALDPVKGDVYVVDTMNNRVQKFDAKGSLLQTIGRLGSSFGDFNRPTDIALDRKGNIYVADTGNNRVQKFDPSGKVVSEWGRFARRERGAGIRNPVSVAYSDEGFGFLYVMDLPDCRVRKFDLDGAPAGDWPLHPKGEGAACGPSRIRIEPRRYTVYIADTENDRILLFTKDGDPAGEFRGGKTPFKKPAGLGVINLFGEDLVVADSGNNLIQKFRRAK